MVAKGDAYGIRSLAEQQFGVLGHWQLLRRGVHRKRISAWLDRGRLVVVFEKAYALGHPSLTREGRYMAAVLSAGPDARLSCRAAGALWGIKQSGRIDVTTTRNVKRVGFTVHRVREAPPATWLRGIPITTPMRTLADLAEIKPDRRYLETAIDNACVRDLFDGNELNEILKARLRRRGASVLRELLTTHTAGTTLTASAVEEALVALVDAARLPRPSLNVPLTLGDGTEIRADAVWARERLIVEVDAEHTHRRRFHSDRRRDALLQADGWTVVRFTDVQIRDDPAYIIATLTALLATRR